MNPFTKLPHDLLDWFLSDYLDFRSQMTCRKVCKRFNINIKIRQIPNDLHKKLTSNILKQFPLLTTLDANYNPKITDEDKKRLF